MNRPPYEKDERIAELFDHARALAAQIGYTLEDLKTGGGSDGNFTAAIAPTLDGLGVDGKGGHTPYEQINISSIAPRSELFYRLFETSPETFFLVLGMSAESAKEMAARYQYEALEFKE